MKQTNNVILINVCRYKLYLLYHIIVTNNITLLILNFNSLINLKHINIYTNKTRS